MKRRVLLLLFAALFAFAAPVHADVFLLGFTGFDYETFESDAVEPDLDGSVYLTVGEAYNALGFVTSYGPLLATYADPSEYEYTFYMTNLYVSSHSWDSIFLFLEVQFQNNGRGRYYQDGKAGCMFCTPGTAATFGTGPPNATAPSTFTDGVLTLGGDIDNFGLFYDYAANQGGFSGQMTQDEGTWLGYIPVPQRAGWTLGGLAGRPNETVPAGYDNQVSGSCYIPDPVSATHKTWGAIKALYR